MRMRTGARQVAPPCVTNDRRNILQNSLLNRWTATSPAPWTSGTITWTKCGVGEADTENRATTYCAKINTNGGASRSTTYTLSAAELLQVLGKRINFSLWVKPSAGMTLGANVFQILITPTVPNWAVGTDYYPGEAVNPSTGVGTYLFLQGNLAGDMGTSAAVTEPTWPTAVHDTVVDNDITWVTYNRGPNQTATSTITQADADAPAWKRLSLDHYVPLNATALTLTIYFWEQSGGADSEYYISEPTLLVGRQGPDSVTAGQQEFDDHIQVGGNKMSWGAAVPGASTGWHAQGDVHWNTGAATAGSPGWVCITAGADAAAVWETMAVTASIP
jgi:hypothetical protein